MGKSRWRDFRGFPHLAAETFDNRARCAYNPRIGDSQARRNDNMADKVKVDVWFDYA